MADAPFYRIINGKWKPLPFDDKPVGITDPKLKEGYVGDISSLDLPQLEELLIRQEKILSSRALISKLKDKGKQAQERKEELLAEIKKKKEGAAQAIAKTELTPVFVPPKDIHSIEWTGEFKETSSVANDLDSDDDEFCDPLQLMATHSLDTPACIKKTAREESIPDPDPSAAIQKYLECLTVQDEQHEGEPIKEDEKNKTSECMNNQGIKREPFKPFRNVKRAHIERKKERNPHLWQECAAVGPLGDTSRTAIVIPLKESIQLLERYQMNEKRRLIEDTASKLSQIGKMDIGLPSSDVLKYRDTNRYRHVLDDESSDDEEERED